jgi:hypothetical protein
MVLLMLLWSFEGNAQCFVPVFFFLLTSGSAFLFVGGYVLSVEDCFCYWVLGV